MTHIHYCTWHSNTYTHKRTCVRELSAPMTRRRWWAQHNKLIAFLHQHFRSKSYGRSRLHQRDGLQKSSSEKKSRDEGTERKGGRKRIREKERGRISWVYQNITNEKSHILWSSIALMKMHKTAAELLMIILNFATQLVCPIVNTGIRVTRVNAVKLLISTVPRLAST